MGYHNNKTSMGKGGFMCLKVLTHTLSSNTRVSQHLKLKQPSTGRSRTRCNSISSFNTLAGAMVLRTNTDHINPSTCIYGKYFSRVVHEQTWILIDIKILSRNLISEIARIHRSVCIPDLENYSQPLEESRVKTTSSEFLLTPVPLLLI